MSPELASIVTRLDLAYDNLLSTAVAVHNLANDPANPDRDHFTKGERAKINAIVDTLEALVKKEVR